MQLIRWVGGKSRLTDVIKSNFPTDFKGRFFEPFFGSGAVGLSTSFKEINASDLNVELMNFYDQIKSDPKAVHSVYQTFKNDKDTYLEVRAWDRDQNFLDRPAAERAARFFFLNKSCFNGLYRVNVAGFYNVAYGKPKSITVPLDEFERMSDSIQHVNFSCHDFYSTLDDICEGDLVYLDPPYVPISDTSGFSKYTPGEFTIDDHRRLARFCRIVHESGAKFVLSNSDTNLTRELYADYKISTVPVKRLVGPTANTRHVVNELIIKNF